MGVQRKFSKRRSIRKSNKRSRRVQNRRRYSRKNNKKRSSRTKRNRKITRNLQRGGGEESVYYSGSLFQNIPKGNIEIITNFKNLTPGKCVFYKYDYKNREKYGKPLTQNKQIPPQVFFFKVGERETSVKLNTMYKFDKETIFDQLVALHNADRAKAVSDEKVRLARDLTAEEEEEIKSKVPVPLPLGSQMKYVTLTAVGNSIGDSISVAAQKNPVKRPIEGTYVHNFYGRETKIISEIDFSDIILSDWQYSTLYRII